MPTNLHSLINDNLKIFSLPTVFLRLSEAVNNPRSSVADIGRIISEDQGLTVRLLRMANSPMYGYPSKIETISQAVLIIGTSQIRDLTLATSVTKLFKGLPEELLNMETFWRHSIACGVVARIIAGYRREPNVEAFFTAGILHDIGRLIMFTKMPVECQKIINSIKEKPVPLFKAEREALGYDHADVGELLLKTWKLPSSLIEAVSCHHSPQKAEQYRNEAAIIHVADMLAHALQLGFSGERFVPALSHEAWDMLALQEGGLGLLVRQAIQHYNINMQIIMPDEK